LGRRDFPLKGGPPTKVVTKETVGLRRRLGTHDNKIFFKTGVPDEQHRSGPKPADCPIGRKRRKGSICAMEKKETKRSNCTGSYHRK